MKYFAIEGTAYRMTESNYKKLCKLYPYKYRGEILIGHFDTNQGDPFKYDRFGETPDHHSNCLDWIIEHSTELYKINVFNY